MQQDDHRNRYTCHPENYVADHEGSPSLTGMRRRSPKVKRAGTDVSRWPVGPLSRIRQAMRPPWRRAPNSPRRGCREPNCRSKSEQHECERCSQDCPRKDGTPLHEGQARCIGSRCCDLCHGGCLCELVQSEEAQYEHHHDDEAHKVNDAVHIAYLALTSANNPPIRLCALQMMGYVRPATWFLRRPGRTHSCAFALLKKSPRTDEVAARGLDAHAHLFHIGALDRVACSHNARHGTRSMGSGDLPSDTRRVCAGSRNPENSERFHASCANRDRHWAGHPRKSIR